MITITHDATLNHLFAALRQAVCESQHLVLDPAVSHESYRESLGREIELEAEIIRYVIERERRKELAGLGS